MEKELKSLTENMGDSTAKSYAASYRRLRKIMELTDKRRPLKKINIGLVLDKISKIENPSTRHSVFVIVKKLYDYNANKEILDDLDQQIRKDKRELQIAKNGHLDKSLPTFKEISDAVKKETIPKKYITSFLMLKVNTRNQDIALIDLHKDVDEDSLDKDRNHIVIKDGKAIYIRNKYKTFKKYGQKRNVIVVKKFVDMVNEELGDANSKPLFARKNGEKIAEASTGSYLKRYVVLGLNEGQIMKAVLKHIDNKGSYDMLRKVSNNRGTNIATLLSEYDVSNVAAQPDNVISQEQSVKQDVEIEA